MTVVALTSAGLLFGSCRRDPETAKRAYYDSAMSHFDQAKYPEAIIELRNALQIDPRFGAARFKLAQAYARAGDAPNALHEAVRSADQLPDNVEAQLTAGRLLLLARQFEDAKARARKVLETNPRNVDAQVLLGNALAGMRDLDGAVSEMTIALELDPSRVTSYTVLGQMQRAQGDVRAAEATFRNAVAIAPKSLKVHLAMGNFFWSTGRQAEAESAFKDALAIDRRDPLANHALATLYISTGRLTQAEPLFVTMAEDQRTPAARLQLADFYLASSRIDEAVKVLTALTNEPTSGAEATVRLSAIDYAQGRKDSAHKRIDQMLAARPNDAMGLIVKARFLLLDNKVTEALAAARSSVASNPSVPGAYYTLGSIELARHDYDAASDAFTEVLKLRPSDTAARIQLAQIALANGAADRSARLAAEAKAHSPHDVGARVLLVRALLAKSDFKAAQEEMRPLLAAGANSAPIQALHGSLLALEKNEAGARAAYTRALEIDPDNVDAFGGLISLDMQAGRINLVRNEIEGRLARTPDNPDLLLLAARTFEISGDRPKQEQALRRVIEVEPMNLTAYSRLAGLYVQEHRLDDARTQFDAITARYPKSVGAQTMAAMLVELQGNSDEAERRYDAVLAMNPRAAVAANNLAWRIAEKGGNLDTALQLAQTAKAQMPDAAEVDDTLGWIYYKKGLLDQAVRSFDEAAQRVPSAAVYRFHLGLAYAQRGDKPKAVAALGQAIALKLAGTDAAEANRLLTSLSAPERVAESSQRN